MYFVFRSLFGDVPSKLCNLSDFDSLQLSDHWFYSLNHDGTGRKLNFPIKLSARLLIRKMYVKQEGRLILKAVSYGVPLGSKVCIFSGTKNNFSRTKNNISGTKNNFSATKINFSGTKINFSPTNIIFSPTKIIFSATKINFSPTKINFSPTKNTDF